MTAYKAYVATGAGGVATTWSPHDGGTDIPFVTPVTPPTGGGTTPPTGGGTTPPTGGGTTPPTTGYVTPTVANMTNVLDDQFTTLDLTRWKVYDNDHFGSPKRVQLYKAANVVAGAATASAGATNGTSVKLMSKAEAVTLAGVDYKWTAGMLDTQSTNTYFPRYGRYEFRCKVPHGQGLWPSIWLTTTKGASVCEIDIMEYFHSQVPGKNSTTMHGSTSATSGVIPNRYTNNGSAAANGWGRTFFEAPTYTPGWHVWTQDIIPVTDATGTVRADINAPSNYVQCTTYVDGKMAFQFVDTQAAYWTANGGTADRFWQFYVNGCQIGGPDVGLPPPDDPLGYSSQKGGCLIGGTAPNACTITTGGYTVQAPHFSDPASTLEVDYIRVYKLTS